MSEDAPWELIYHPGIAGRAEFIRLVFEEAGVPYKNVGDTPEHVFQLVRDGQMGGFPAFAPPAIRKGTFTLAQTAVICRYLGRQFGMWPDTEEDEWHAEQVNLTIHDFIAEGRLVFHGRGFVESYYTQKAETQPYIDWFVRERFNKWLGLLEKTLAANGDGLGFVVGSKLTYADLGLLHVLRAAASQFPEAWGAAPYPLLKAFKERLSARPNLAAYFQSERCRPFEGNSMM